MWVRSDVMGLARVWAACLALAVACAAWSPAGHAATDEPAGFELILLDGYEDCGLAYRDLDADTFGGDSDVRIQCPPLPAGYVAIGGDCNDANPLINPGVAEPAPDAQFLDENCDGVDGNVALALFVAPGGSGAVDCGTRELPCSIAAAPARAQAANRTQLYLRAGNHTGMAPLNGFTNGLAFHGGYDANWVRAPRSVNLSRIEGGAVAQLGTVGAEFSNGSYVLDELEVTAPSASGTVTGGAGGTSYGVRVLAGAALSITRSSIVAGAGFPGQNGSNGSSASQALPATGGTGGSGDQFLTVCNDTSRGTRGSAGSNPGCTGSRSTTGGQGGLGGTMDASCSGIGGTCFGSDCDATSGTAGGNAIFVTATSGTGGFAGPPCGGSSGADPGFVTDGSGGAGGSKSRGQLSFSPARWSGFAGNAGAPGENGGGGGGGGGAGGCDTGTDSFGDGGGGGGAGGCRAPLAGAGGRPGGGSIAVFAVQATSLAISNSTVVVLGGGDGGFGGSGGTGQPGGLGGPGGSGPGGANGGSGANGGRGGHAGGGGGGAGGVSVGVFAYQVSPSSSNLTPQIAPAGQGGAGGGGQIGGQDGTNGSAATILSCAAPAGC